MIDLHSHVLPGVDDGARTPEGSRELARRAAAEGITAIAATPHVRADCPTTVDRIEEASPRFEPTSPMATACRHDRQRRKDAAGISAGN